LLAGLRPRTGVRTAPVGNAEQRRSWHECSRIVTGRSGNRSRPSNTEPELNPARRYRAPELPNESIPNSAAMAGRRIREKRWVG